MAAEHVLEIGTNPGITLIYGHCELSFFEQAAKFLTQQRGEISVMIDGARRAIPAPNPMEEVMMRNFALPSVMP